MMNLICNVTVNRFSVRVSALSPLKGTGSDYTMSMMDLFLKGYDAANYSNCNESRKVYLKFPFLRMFLVRSLPRICNPRLLTIRICNPLIYYSLIGCI